MEKDALIQEIEELENKFSSLTVQRERVQQSIRARRRKSNRRERGERISINRNDQNNQELFIGDQVRVLTKRSEKAEFADVLLARVIGVNGAYLHLVSIGTGVKKKGFRKAHDLRNIEEGDVNHE